jgi:hypothetical protein
LGSDAVAYITAIDGVVVVVKVLLQQLLFM